MKTVDEVISEWTKEEREQLKDLIEECREREKRLIENSNLCKANLAKMTECLRIFYSDLYKIKMKAGELEKELFGIYLIWCNQKNLPS
jgi:hypothetical protein